MPKQFCERFYEAIGKLKPLFEAMPWEVSVEFFTDENFEIEYQFV